MCCLIFYFKNLKLFPLCYQNFTFLILNHPFFQIYIKILIQFQVSFENLTIIPIFILKFTTFYIKILSLNFQIKIYTFLFNYLINLHQKLNTIQKFTTLYIKVLKILPLCTIKPKICTFSFQTLTPKISIPTLLFLPLHYKFLQICSRFIKIRVGNTPFFAYTTQPQK